MSGQTINQSATRIEALQLQSSAYGVTLALAFGRARLPGNLLWYGGFKAIAHTQTQSGKGGGVKVQNTTYTYQASVIMGLCEGPVLEVSRIWRGKNAYSGGYAPTQLLQAHEVITVPQSGTYTLAHAPAPISNLPARLLGRVTIHLPDADPSRGGNRLVEGRDFSLSASGTLTFSNHAGRRVAIRYQYATDPQPQTAMQQLGLTLMSGQVGQPTWSHLTTHVPAQAIPYSGIAAVAGQDYDLGTGAQVENHTFEVLAPLKYVVADRATGEIQTHGTCFDVDLDAVPVLAHQVKLVADANPATHYHDEVLGLQPYTAAQQAAKAQRVPHSRWDNRAMAWVDARPLEALRADRWALIKGARAAAMDAPIDTSFGVFDADPASRSALVEAVALGGAGGRDTVRWTTADNLVVELTLEQLAGVALQIARRTEQCHEHAQQLRVRIEQAATAGELEAIRW